MTIRARQPHEFGDFVSPEGKLDRPLPMSPLYAPGKLTLHPKGNGFLWSARAMQPVVGGEPQLQRFVTLADASDRRIMQFASRYGVFGFCKHDVPYTHDGAVRIAGARDAEPCSALQTKGGFFEPFECWRRMAAEARAILNIATRHQDDGNGDASDWETLKRSPAQPRTKRLVVPGSALEKDRLRLLDFTERLRLLDYVYVWMTIANVRPHGFRRATGVIAVGLSGGLAGALAVQLLTAVTRTSGLARCASCGEFFTAERRVSASRQRYCPSCGRKASTRDASKRYRDKRRQQQRGG